MPSLHRAAAAAVALSCLPLVPALAVDPVDRSRVATVVVELADGSGGALRLSLRVWDAEPVDRVDVRLETCDEAGCAYPAFHAGTVDADAVTLDPTEASGSARLVLDGRLLSLSWEPGSGLVVSAGEVTGAGESVTGGTYVGTPAVAGVEVDGASCSTRGAVGDGVRLAVPEGSSGATRPLEDLRLPGALSCPVD